MTTRLLVTIEVELEITDNEALAAAALSMERSRKAVGRTEESFAQLESDLHVIPGLGEGFLRDDPKLLFANVPGVQVTGSRAGGRLLAEGERLFPSTTQSSE